MLFLHNDLTLKYNFKLIKWNCAFFQKWLVYIKVQNSGLGGPRGVSATY